MNEPFDQLSESEKLNFNLQIKQMLIDELDKIKQKMNSFKMTQEEIIDQIEIEKENYEKYKKEYDEKRKTIKKLQNILQQKKIWSKF